VVASVARSLKGLKSKEYSLKQAENLLPDIEDEIQVAIDFMTPLYREFLEESGQLGGEIIDPDFTFDADTPQAQSFIDDRSQFFADSINETTYQKLIATIDEGIANDETLTEISERIKVVYEGIDKFRPELIARTEVSAISNFGNNEGQKQAGATQKMWIVVDPDDDPCLIDGEIAEIDGQFTNGFEFPPVHPNCQCSTVPIF